jgi:hypothetical protein
MSAVDHLDLGPDVAEPFRSDEDFWRSVCASADAALLLVVAAAASVVLRLTGAGIGFVWLPFAVPMAFLVRAAVSGLRFHRGHERPSVVETPRGGQSWRDAERGAVATVFGRALVRGRLQSG